jgi:hypothetical protein
LGCAATASAAGNVFIYEHGRAQRRDDSYEARTISPVEARMVLAQRAGVEQYHSSGLQQDGAIEAMNDYGSKSDLFDKEGSQPQQAVFLVDVPEEHEEAFCKLDILFMFECDADNVVRS